MVQTLYQTHHLDIENLLARCLHILTLGDEGIRIDIAEELERTLAGSLASDFASVGITLCINESGIGATLNMQRLHINLTHFDLWLQRESVALFEQSAILKNNSITAINHILGRLAKTAAGINVTANHTGTLLGKQRLKISMLTNQFVAGREVEDHIGTSQSQVVAWWCGCPYILADLDTELHAIGSNKHLRFG